MNRKSKIADLWYIYTTPHVGIYNIDFTMIIYNIYFIFKWLLIYEKIQFISTRWMIFPDKHEILLPLSKANWNKLFCKIDKNSLLLNYATIFMVKLCKEQKRT